MEEKLRKDVEAVVAKIFSEKEEVEIRRQTEDALGKSANTIEELTTALEAKNSEFEDLEVKLSDSEDRATNLQTELEAAQEGITEANRKLEESESKLNDLVKDRATELRVKELIEAGVISDKEVQSVKVRDMSDEEFASYKTELVSIREAVIAELSKKVVPPAKTEEELAAEAKAVEDARIEAEALAQAEADNIDGTPPANIDLGQAVSAALNLEIFPPKDMVIKYAEMGQAMAKLLTNSN
jgi:septal ring factor EnvC (AmiA/AmiB activator)